ncbi:MAG: DUF3187 family protein [Woeseia sp.]|nr:DUF3187 family protein [Woeseia sp.]NNE61951.1 DUF3187 family protein [Woeseia sp.]
MSRRIFALTLVSAFACAPVCAVATALPDPDLSPLIATIGLPRANEGANLLPQSVTRWRTSVATASHSVQDSNDDETLLFDGETTRLAVGIDYGVSERLQIGLEVPYLLHESGGLDHFVESWHDWFGLPNGIRGLTEDDQLNFFYQSPTAEQLSVQQNQRGLGDIRLLAAWQLNRDAHSATAVRASLQLPTGKSERLTGSGSGTLSFGIAGDYSEIFGRPRFSSFYRANLVAPLEPDRFADRAKPLIGVFAAGISAQANSRLELTLQGLLRSAAYDSDTRMLGEAAFLLNVGGTISLSDTLELTIAVGEDLRVDSAPDVTLALMLQYAPLND